MPEQTTDTRSTTTYRHPGSGVVTTATTTYRHPGIVAGAK